MSHSIKKGVCWNVFVKCCGTGHKAHAYACIFCGDWEVLLETNAGNSRKHCMCIFKGSKAVVHLASGLFVTSKCLICSRGWSLLTVKFKNNIKVEKWGGVLSSYLWIIFFMVSVFCFFQVCWWLNFIKGTSMLISCQHSRGAWPSTQALKQLFNGGPGESVKLSGKVLTHHIETLWRKVLIDYIFRVLHMQTTMTCSWF